MVAEESRASDMSVMWPLLANAAVQPLSVEKTQHIQHMRAMMNVLTFSLEFCPDPLPDCSVFRVFFPLFPSLPGFWVKLVKDEATSRSFLSKGGRDQQAALP